MVNGAITSLKIVAKADGVLKIYCSQKVLREAFSDMDCYEKDGEQVLQKEMKKGEEIFFQK